MKRIVILCDGTWNRSDSDTPTNVVRFAQALRPTDADEVRQVAFYVQGVGTGRGPTPALRQLDSWLGGAFGHGLMENIEEAYRHLLFNYEVGDEIHIVGFSRGAYTARSLTGLIRSTGLIGRGQMHRIREAIERYRTLGDERTHPNHEASHRFRADISPAVATSPAEMSWRENRGLPTGHLLRIAYLGVWDSVGALGVPAFIPVLGPRSARRHRFHDANLSSMVRSARHAVALDERRKSFAPTRWDNVAELNAEVENGGPPPYQEQFFPGDHGSVGGGGDITELSSIGLAWIIEGAQAAGLAFDAERLAQIGSEQNPMGPLRNTTTKPTGFSNWLMRRNPEDRQGPTSLSELHSSTMLRWSGEAKSEGFEPYRPRSLSRVHRQLAANFDATTGTEAKTRNA